MIIDVNEPGQRPHTEISGADIHTVDIFIAANKSGGRITTKDLSGMVLDDKICALWDYVLIVCPEGNWQWETSADGVRYRKLFVMPGRPPYEPFRCANYFSGAFSPATWTRFTKV